MVPVVYEKVFVTGKSQKSTSLYSEILKQNVKIEDFGFEFEQAKTL